MPDIFSEMQQFLCIWGLAANKSADPHEACRSDKNPTSTNKNRLRNLVLMYLQGYSRQLSLQASAMENQ